MECFDSILGAGSYHYTLYNLQKDKAQNHQKSKKLKEWLDGDECHVLQHTVISKSHEVPR